MQQELRQEAVQCRRLSHQNIVQLYDLYEAPSEDSFLVMEFVEGASLLPFGWARCHRFHMGRFAAHNPAAL